MKKPLLFALCLVLAQPVVAAPVVSCDALQSVVTVAGKGFQSDMPDTLAGAESCRMSLSLSGAKTFTCAWPFPFRDPVAGQAFDATIAALETCLPGAALAGPDQLVNHPDSYDLRQYDLGKTSISVSLKDKGALGLTYVFLGVGAP